MPLQNPDKIVTEERLAEFYQQILPYMGGMPDVMMSKFSKSDIYSPDERMIGVWTDGKPIYQRVIEHSPAISIPLLGSAGATVYTDANIDKVLYGITYASSGVGQVVTWFKSGNDVKASATSYAVTAVRTILKYTKTTDSAVEIGDGTDYSTTEKIVGTWIDGKPVYKKTFNPTVSSATTDVTHNIENIGTVVKIEGMTKYNNLDSQIPIPYASTTGANAQISVGGVTSTIFKIYRGSNITSMQDCYITLYYTKTSS